MVIDFIDMEERKHVGQVEKTFKNALSIDRSRIQLAKISKFGLLELTRQKKQSTLQEISYVECPHCKGTGVRPSLESLALRIYRKIKGEAVSGTCATLSVLLPPDVSDYLLNQKRSEIAKLETLYKTGIQIRGSYNVPWGQFELEIVRKEPEGPPEIPLEAETEPEDLTPSPAHKAEDGEARKKSRSRRRRRRPRKKIPAAAEEAVSEAGPAESEGSPSEGGPNVPPEGDLAVERPAAGEEPVTAGPAD